MIDATMIITAQSGARSTSAKSAAAAANGSSGQGPGFAGFLANATEDVGAEMESGGKLSIATAEGSGAKKEKSDTIIAEVANGGDPAAMIALLVTESRAALAPGAYLPSGDAASAGPGEGSTVTATAIGAAEYPGLVEPPAQAIEPTGGKAALAASSGQSIALPRHAVKSAGSADKSDTVATAAAARSPAAKSKVAHVAGAEAAIGRSAAAKTGTANATAANSTVASTAAADAPAGNVKMANAMVAAATVASATVANPTVANATAANATVANATVASATVANATVANATVANATVANATAANATVANATVANATVANATVANATAANATAANATAANATAANTTAANATAANATAASATAGKATVAYSTAANATAANATPANATLTLTTRSTFATAGTESINDGAPAVSSELPAVDSRPTQPAIARNPASPAKTTNPIGRAPVKVIDTRDGEGPHLAGLPARSSQPAGVRIAVRATSGATVDTHDSGPKYGTKPALNGAHVAGEAEPASSAESTIAPRGPSAVSSTNKPPADTYVATPRPDRGTDPSAGLARPIPGARGIAGSPAAVDAADQHAELIPVSTPTTATIPDPANAEARGADRKDFPATTAAAAHGRSSEGPAVREPGSRLTGQVKLADSGEAATVHKGAEPEPVSVRHAETASSVSAMSVAAANVADARGTVAVGPAATLLVAAHVQSPAWGKDFGQQVIRLAMDGQPAAEIHLNPADWGPIRVAIDIRGQEAVLQFSAAHGQTREALENALPRLREMFAADNLSLTGANVDAGSFSRQSSNPQGQRFDHPHAAPQNERPKVVNAELAGPIVRPRPDGSHSRVDLFA